MKTVRMMLAALAAGSFALAQDVTVESPTQSKPIFIRNTTIHVGNGQTLKDKDVILRGGRIGAIGDLLAPQEAEIVEGEGLHLWPGMISAVTQIGINEISSVSATRDYDEIGEFTPEARAVVAINPDSTPIPVTRTNGVLACGVFPSGGTIPGTAGVVELAGWTWEDMTVRAEAGTIVRWPAIPTGDRGDPKDTIEARERIDATFRDARAWLAAKRADASIPYDVRKAALGPTLDGKAPVFINADDEESIRSSVLWARELGLRPAIVGGAEADHCAAFLVENSVGVIVAGTHRLPRRRDLPHNRPFRLPALLEKAGVVWCLGTGTRGYENERNLPYHAATAVAYGLDPEVAIQAVTSRVAQILGVDDKLGTIESGKNATLFLADGNPLEFTTKIRAIWISGRRIEMNNKQTQLAEMYREKYRQLGLIPRDK